MDEELSVGVASWNARDYLQAQEEFEHLWRVEVGPRRQLLRGLIHAAMGFHYATMRDLLSARSKLSSAAALLDGFAGDFCGLDVEGLRAGIALARARLEEAEGGPPQGTAGPPILGLLPAVAGSSIRETVP